MVCNITFQKTSGETINLTIDEARELYNELTKLFNTNLPKPIDWTKNHLDFNPLDYNHGIVNCGTDVLFKS